MIKLLLLIFYLFYFVFFEFRAHYRAHYRVHYRALPSFYILVTSCERNTSKIVFIVFTRFVYLLLPNCILFITYHHCIHCPFLKFPR